MKGREEEFQLDEKGNILKDMYRIPHMVANVWKKKSNDKEVLLHSNKYLHSEYAVKNVQLYVKEQILRTSLASR